MNSADMPDEVLDALGLACPQPVVRARERLEVMRPDQVLEVRADDPLAELDLQVFCERFGHDFLGGIEAAGYWRIRIRKRSSDR